MISNNMKITKQNILYLLVLVQVACLFILPPIDGTTSGIRNVLWGLFGGISIVVMCYAFIKKRVVFSTYSSIVIVIFFGLCFVSGIWALYNEISVGDIIRGIMPFLWLAYILFLPNELNRQREHMLLNLLSIVVLAYALRIVIFYLIYVRNNIYERVTFHLYQSTSFMTMFGVLLFVYLYLTTCQRRYILGYVVTYVSVILTETKAMLACVLVGLVLFSLLLYIGERNSGREKKFFFSKKMLLLLCTGVVIMVALFVTTKLGYRWKNAVEISEKVEENDISSDVTTGNIQNDSFKPSMSIEVKDVGSVSVRMVEYVTAVEKWKESPIFGKGLGYRWDAKELGYGGSVMYMHNILAYLLMDFGIIGIVFIVIVIVSFMVMLLRIMRLKKMNQDILQFLFLFSALIMAFAYANFFAVFRTIEFIFLISIIVSMIVEKSGRIKED